MIKTIFKSVLANMQFLSGLGLAIYYSATGRDFDTQSVILIMGLFILQELTDIRKKLTH